MNLSTIKYNVPSTLQFYDSKVENDLGICYALNKGDINTKIEKYTIGRFINNSVSGTEFFQFISDGNQIHPFDEHYNQPKAYSEKTKITCISKTTSQAITFYYNESENNFCDFIR